jgi:tyrosine-specific transport protein
MQIVHTFGHLVGGTLLVAGTSIGVGMLALPVATAAGGFLPSLMIYFLCWFFMLCTRPAAGCYTFSSFLV